MLKLHKFDSKNTSTTEELKTTKAKAIEIAKKISLNFYKVILQEDENWNEYENGERVAWSYPNGIK